MSDDLVKRLRERADLRMLAGSIMDEAADRIEQLEAALRKWQSYGCPDCGGDCASANPPMLGCIMQETRAALEGKKDE